MKGLRAKVISMDLSSDEADAIRAAMVCLYGQILTGGGKIPHPKTGMLLPLYFNVARDLVDRMDSIVEELNVKTNVLGHHP